MSIHWVIKNEDRYLKITSTGSCDEFPQLKEYVLAIHNATVASGHTKVLVDETQLEYKLSKVDTFNSGKFISEFKPKPDKVAVICKSEGWDDARFWETVAVNRGVFVKVFRDQDKAEIWLQN